MVIKLDGTKGIREKIETFTVKKCSVPNTVTDFYYHVTCYVH